MKQKAVKKKEKKKDLSKMPCAFNKRPAKSRNQITLPLIPPSHHIRVCVWVWL